MSIIFECKDLTKKYGAFTAVENLNLSIERGKIIGLLGPNGSGKTTLIKMSNGLLTPTKGEILIDGKKVGVETKSIVSYLPERTYLNDWMKVKEMVGFFDDFYEDFDAQCAYKMFERLNININDKLKTMSKGTKEKVQLILVMSRTADIYILDEPENSLSAENQLKLKRFIEDSTRFYNCQFIISTHSPFLLKLMDAKIYDLDDTPVVTKKWTELSNVLVYYNFFKQYEEEFDKK